MAPWPLITVLTRPPAMFISSCRHHLMSMLTRATQWRSMEHCRRSSRMQVKMYIQVCFLVIVILKHPQILSMEKWNLFIARAERLLMKREIVWYDHPPLSMSLPLELVFVTTCANRPAQRASRYRTQLHQGLEDDH